MPTHSAAEITAVARWVNRAVVVRLLPSGIAPHGYHAARQRNAKITTNGTAKTRESAQPPHPVTISAAVINATTGSHAPR